VSRAEVEDGVPPITTANLKAIQLALQDAGIIFLSEDGRGAGVHFLRPER
jgi:hypothetical protein